MDNCFPEALSIAYYVNYMDIYSNIVILVPTWGLVADTVLHTQYPEGKIKFQHNITDIEKSLWNPSGGYQLFFSSYVFPSNTKHCSVSHSYSSTNNQMPTLTFFASM